MNVKERDKILFGKYEPKKYLLRSCMCSIITKEKLDRLLQKGFISLDDKCLGTPYKIKDFYEFIDKYPEYVVFGITLNNLQGSYATHLLGIEKGLSHNTAEEFSEFTKFADGAATVKFNTMYCDFN